MKKPIALIITDTHIKENNIPLVENIFQQARELCLQRGIKRMIHVGDWFTTRSHQSLECLLSVQDILDLNVANNIETLGIRGNHDCSDQSIPASYMSLFRHKMKLFDREGFVQVGKLTLCFLSFFTDEEYLRRLANLLEETAEMDNKILFTHQSINGVRNNDGSTVEKDIEQDYYGSLRKVIVGHYHNRQKIGNNIYYIGSSHQSNFGEDERKGFVILYDDTSLEYVESDYPKYINLKIHVDDVEEIQSAKESFANIDDNVKLTLIGDKDKAKSIHKEVFKDTGIDVRFNSISESTLFESSAEHIADEAKVFTDKDLAKFWIRYSTKQGIPTSLRNAGLKFFTS